MYDVNDSWMFTYLTSLPLLNEISSLLDVHIQRQESERRSDLLRAVAVTLMSRLQYLADQ
jgi:hypothetical protein